MIVYAIILGTLVFGIVMGTIFHTPRRDSRIPPRPKNKKTYI